MPATDKIPVSVTTGALAALGIVTRDALAIELSVSTQTVVLWEKDGLPVLRIRQQRYYDVIKVAAWMRRGQRK